MLARSATICRAMGPGGPRSGAGAEVEQLAIATAAVAAIIRRITLSIFPEGSIPGASRHTSFSGPSSISSTALLKGAAIGNVERDSGSCHSSPSREIPAGSGEIPASYTRSVTW